MSDARFEYALRFVLKWEGGPVDHPADPGGRTNYGVTQAVYDNYRNTRGLPRRDVFVIDSDEVRDIYLNGYWRPAGCGMLPEPLDVIQFDTAVQRGNVKAKKMLQAALGVDPDGIIGPATMQALHEEIAAGTIESVAQVYIDMRADHYRRRVAENASQSVFLKGWMNRLGDLERVIA